MRKARGYSGEKASGLISIRIVYAHEHFIYDLNFDPVGPPLHLHTEISLFSITCTQFCHHCTGWSF